MNKICAGCGRELEEGEEVVEVARTWVYCKELCAIDMEYTNAAA